MFEKELEEYLSTLKGRSGSGGASAELKKRLSVLLRLCPKFWTLRD